MTILNTMVFELDIFLGNKKRRGSRPAFRFEFDD